MARQPTPTLPTTDIGSAGGALDMSFDYKSPNPVGVRTATVDQLRALKDGKRDLLSEISYAAVGLAGGAVPTAIPTLWNFLSGAVTLSRTEMLHVMLFLLGLIVFVTCTAVVRTRGRNVEDVYDAIVNPRGRDEKDQPALRPPSTGHGVGSNAGNE